METAVDLALTEQPFFHIFWVENCETERYRYTYRGGDAKTEERTDPVGYIVPIWERNAMSYCVLFFENH